MECCIGEAVTPNSERKEASLMAEAKNRVWIVVIVGGTDHGKSSLSEVIKRYAAYHETKQVFSERTERNVLFNREPKAVVQDTIPDTAGDRGLTIDLHISADGIFQRLKDQIERQYKSIQQRFCDGLKKRMSESSRMFVCADRELSYSEDLKLNLSKVMELNHGENQKQYHYADLGLRHSEDAGLLVQCNVLELWMKELCDGLTISTGKEFADMICHLLNQELGLLREMSSDRRLILILQNDWKKIMLKSRKSEKRFADWYREGPPNNYEICHTLSTAA